MRTIYITAIAVGCLTTILGTATGFPLGSQTKQSPYPTMVRTQVQGWRATLWQTSKKTPRYSELWGAWPNDVAPVTTDLFIKNGNSQVPVGGGAFLDLARVELLRFEERNGVRFLIIEGGGDGLGYRAELEIRKNEVVRRKVSSSTFPKDAYEETFYKYNNLDN